jgi:hypothetical protein
MPRTLASLPGAIASVVLLLGAGCSTSMDRKDALSRLGDGSMTGSQLRYRVFVQARSFVDVVELTADSIATRRPGLRRTALQWKVGATGAVLTRSFQPDPLLGLLGSWSLAREMRCFFERGAGTRLFGPSQQEVVDVCRRLEAAAKSIAESASPARAADAEAKLAAWVDAHPVADLHFALESTGQHTANLLAGQQSDVFGAVGSIEERTQFLTDLLPAAVPILAKLLRWQAELVVDDTLRSETADTLIGKVGGIEDALQRLAGVAVALPEIVAKERAQVLAGIDHQRELAVGDVGKQRELVIEALRAEVANVETVVGRQREEVFTAIDRQRAAMLLAVGEERQATLTELGSIVEKTLLRAPQAADQVVVRYWWWTALAACAFAALCGAGAYLGARDLLRRRLAP